MKKLLLTCVISALSLIVVGQEVHREAGMRLMGLNNFDFIYKRENAKGFKRYRLAFTNLSYFNQNDAINLGLGMGFALGWERRKVLDDRLLLIHGWEPFITLSYNYADNGGQFQGDNLILTPGIGYVIGLQYNITETIYTSLEATPSLNGNFIIDDNPNNDGYGINGSFATQNIALSVVYRFKTSVK